MVKGSVERLRSWAHMARRDTLALYYAGRDPRVPWYAKAMAMGTAAYALSPLDLIPDFVPILGYLDDLIILPICVVLTVRLIPVDIMEELRRQAEISLAAGSPRSRWGAVFVLLVWLVLAGFLVALVWR